MQIDTSRVRVFHGSLIKLALISLAGVGMTALSAAIALRWAGRAEPGSSEEFTGFVGLLFFGAATCLTLRRLVRIRTPILTLTFDGFLDVRLSTAPIPWSVVEHITTWKRWGQNLVALNIGRAEIDRLPLTRIARWNLGLDRMMGADRLYLASQDLPIGHRDLLELCIAYAEAAERDRECTAEACQLAAER